jgi:hypothetical protein
MLLSEFGLINKVKCYSYDNFTKETHCSFLFFEKNGKGKYSQVKMLGIIGVSALLVVLALSLLITKLATTALTLTGLSEDAARFQARSAFTGTGFTTSEAEKVVNHPVRRNIITILMILRSAGLMTIVISLILSFANTDGETGRLFRLIWLMGGAFILVALSQSRLVDRYTGNLMERFLRRWTNIDTRDYAKLLRLSKNYTVTKHQVQEEDWIAGKTLQECRLTEEGVTVLGIYRESGDYVGAPRGTTEIYPDDTLLLYGRSKTLKDLDVRQAGASGEKAHQEAVSEEKRRMIEQDKEEREYQQKQKDKKEKNSS